MCRVTHCTRNLCNFMQSASDIATNMLHISHLTPMNVLMSCSVPAQDCHDFSPSRLACNTSCKTKCANACPCCSAHHPLANIITAPALGSGHPLWPLGKPCHCGLWRFDGRGATFTHVRLHFLNFTTHRTSTNESVSRGPRELRG